MHALAYEGRRLVGVGSSWLITFGALAGAAALTALTGRRLPRGTLSPEQAAGVLTAVPPGLSLPLAAFAAGLLGALSYGHELRYPALRPSLVPVGRRLRLLGAKLCVAAAAAVALVAGTVLVDAAVLRFASPSGVEWSDLLRVQGLPEALLASMALAVATGWVTLLAVGLLRSTIAGLPALLGVAMLSTVAEPVAAVMRSVGVDRGGVPRSALGGGLPEPLTVTGLSAALLLLAWIVVHLMRRTV